MSNAIDSAIGRLRARHGTRDDVKRLRDYLKDPDENLGRIYSAMTNYLKFAAEIDWSIPEAYVNFPADPMISATTISTASLAGCPTEAFWESVRHIAIGEDWDREHDAQVQALLALNLMPSDPSVARKIIQHCLLSESETIRDTAAIAAQRCLGRNPLEIVHDGPHGRLIELVGPDVLTWIWPEGRSSPS